MIVALAQEGDTTRQEHSYLSKLEQAVCEFGVIIGQKHESAEQYVLPYELKVKTNHGLILVLQRRSEKHRFALHVYREGEESHILHCRILGKDFGEDELEIVEKTLLKIEHGGFDREKTTVDKLKLMIKQGKLHSFMSRSKWQKLRAIMQQELPFPPNFITFELINESTDKLNGVLTKRRLQPFATSRLSETGDWEEPFCEFNVEYVCINPYLVVVEKIEQNTKPKDKILNKIKLDLGKIKTYVKHYAKYNEHLGYKDRLNLIKPIQEQIKTNAQGVFAHRLYDISADIEKTLKHNGFDYYIEDDLIIVRCLQRINLALEL